MGAIPKLLLALAILPLSPHAADWTDIATGKGSLLVSQGKTEEQFVDIRGAWTAQSDYAIPRIEKHNDSTISCSRAQMSCTESWAQVALPGNKRPGAPPYLSVFTFQYAITDWSDDLIVAKRINPRGFPVNAVLRIDPRKATVTLDTVERPDSHFQPAEQHYEIAIDSHYGIPGTWPSIPPDSNGNARHGTPAADAPAK